MSLGKNVAEIKGTYDCNGWHCLQYSKGLYMSVPEHNHTAILQDTIPDTLHSTDSAAVAQKDICSCTWLRDQLSSAGCTTSCVCPSENAGKWTQPIRSRQISHTSCVVYTAILFVSSYLCIFNINPKGCRNMTAPVKVLCQLPHPPVQGEGDEITPSCASSEINGAKKAPFCTRQTRKV